MENRGALLSLAIPLLALKVWFAILLLTYAPTSDTVVWVAVTHWPLIIIVALLLGPAVAVFRLWRARLRRERYRRQEFTAEPQCPALWDTVSRLEGE
jgi:membrane protein YdbS with pleckstrin-like domain